MTDANNARKQINIEQGRALVVQELIDFLRGLAPDLEVAVLKPRNGPKGEIQPPEILKIHRIEVNEDWHMLDMRVEDLRGE